MIGIGGFLKIRRVAGKALRRQPRELSDGAAGMAIRALQSGVSSQKRKSVIVLLDLLRLNFPAADRVALGAIGSELAPMQVRMAIRAAGAGLLENEAGMALCAIDLSVHSAKRIRSAVVVKLGNAADWFPAGSCVAVFAGNTDSAVRVPSRPGLRPSGSQCRSESHDTDEQEQESHGPWPCAKRRL